MVPGCDEGQPGGHGPYINMDTGDHQNWGVSTAHNGNGSHEHQHRPGLQLGLVIRLSLDKFFLTSLAFCLSIMVHIFLMGFIGWGFSLAFLFFCSCFVFSLTFLCLFALFYSGLFGFSLVWLFSKEIVKKGLSWISWEMGRVGRKKKGRETGICTCSLKYYFSIE